MPLGHTGHLLYKAIQPRLGDIANLLKHRNKNREATKMRKQRNMSQMKEQEKTPENELNEMKAMNLPDTEFKTLVIKMLNELLGSVDKLTENFNNEITNIKIEVEIIK